MSKQKKLPAMALQELAVKLRMSPPEYQIIHEVSGSHQNFFESQVFVHSVSATGSGSSKQSSKHKAAYNALMKLKDLGIYDPNDIPVEEFDASISKICDTEIGPLNYISTLSDLCFENKILNPIYNEVSDVGPPHNRQFTYECIVASIMTQATGATKKKARHMAAKNMLEKIKDIIPALKEQSSLNQKAIIDANQAVMDKIPQIEFYNSIVPNKSVIVGDYSKTLRKILDEKEINEDEIRDLLVNKTEDNLKQFLHLFELKCNYSHLQSDPYIVILSLNTDTPCSSCGVADNFELAKTKALNSMFNIIRTFLNL